MTPPIIFDIVIASSVQHFQLAYQKDVYIWCIKIKLILLLKNDVAYQSF